MTIPIAVFMGLYLRYMRPGRVLECSGIGFLLVLLSIHAGKLVAASRTIVSVSYHPDLVSYHSQVLELKGDGDWRLHPAAGFHFTENLPLD